MNFKIMINELDNVPNKSYGYGFYDVYDSNKLLGFQVDNPRSYYDDLTPIAPY